MSALDVYAGQLAVVMELHGRLSSQLSQLEAAALAAREAARAGSGIVGPWPRHEDVHALLVRYGRAVCILDDSRCAVPKELLALVVEPPVI